tara:strand:+ start:1604 stop:2419 length:816 start_codon:yes stop_codon:yes gene_type:complete
MKVRAVLVTLTIIIMTTLVQASIDQSEHYFIIEENGNTIVALSLQGSGEITLPLPQDYQNLELEGGLYLIEEGEITIATTDSAVLVYQTSLLTSKSGSQWSFLTNLETETQKSITITMPKNTLISKTLPTAKIESGEFKKLHFDNTNSITIDYSFPAIKPETENTNLTLLLGLAALVLIASVLIIKKIKSQRIFPKQEQLLQTLTDNESSLIRALVSANKSVKRSYLEKKLQIAKSSLAATLQNLERKKLIEIDKTYSSHSIKLTTWFKKL